MQQYSRKGFGDSFQARLLAYPSGLALLFYFWYILCQLIYTEFEINSEILRLIALRMTESEMKKEVIIILLLLLVSFPAVKNLLLPGGFTSHDLTHHVIRQISMDKLLSEGQFPPRWSGELNNGYGYPVFLFNYPLPAMVGAIFHKLGMGCGGSVEAVLFTSLIISVLGMYLFLKELLGSKLSAFLGAVFYLYAPLRFLNVYVSSAVGSALALGIVPFVFWSIILI